MDDFKKRAAASINSSIEQKKAMKRPSQVNFDSHPTKILKEDSKCTNNYSNGTDKPMSEFHILSKIVSHLKTRHQNGERNPLTLKEIIDEIKHLTVTPKTRSWLEESALRNNEKINVLETHSGAACYVYNPQIEISGTKGLQKLIQEQMDGTRGGIPLAYLEESLPRYKQTLEKIKDSVHIISGEGKKEIIFGKTSGLDYILDENIQQVWRTVTIKVLSEEKIIDELKKNKINVSVPEFKRSNFDQKKAKKKKQTKSVQLKHNAHLADNLINYNT